MTTVPRTTEKTMHRCKTICLPPIFVYPRVMALINIRARTTLLSSVRDEVYSSQTRARFLAGASAN